MPGRTKYEVTFVNNPLNEHRIRQIHDLKDKKIEPSHRESDSHTGRRLLLPLNRPSHRKNVSLPAMGLWRTLKPLFT